MYIYIYMYLSLSLYIYIYIYICMYIGQAGLGLRHGAEVHRHLQRGGRILSIEMLLPRIARQRIVRLLSTNNNKCRSSNNYNLQIRARKARTDKFELDEGFQPHHPPFRRLQRADLRDVRRAGQQLLQDLSCDIHTHAHAQDSLHNQIV